MKKSALQQERRAENRDVGPFPKVPAAWKRKRDACAASLKEFCLTFLPGRFTLPFCADHLRVIARLERIVRDGGLLTLAMPRGSGKTELVKAAALWAILYGYRRFVVVIGATATDAVRICEDLKANLSYNDELHAAFPEATHCVRELEGISQRARVQTIDGRPSGLEWKRDGIRLAWVPAKKCPQARCAGAVIRTAGLTGAIRGMSAPGPDGVTIRPDLVLLDDPQDRESATSPAQTDDRERIVRGDVLGLAGPTKAIAAVMPCTVICENDLADRLLDRQANPQWNGERTRLVESFPTAEALWERYFELRADDLRAGGDGKVAGEFYRTRRAEMDAGAVVSWPERFDPARYASAVEEAMVRRHDDPEAFAAEMQNEPVRALAHSGETRELSAAELVGRVTGLGRGVVPRAATRLTGMIDVGGKVLWWGVVAWDEQFNGFLVDYGAFPAQARGYFTAADAAPTLETRYPGMSEPQRVHHGVRELADQLMGRAFARDEGGEGCALDLCLVDARWSTDVVAGAIRPEYRRTLVASMGVSTAKHIRGMDEWPRREGERAGPSWRLGPTGTGRARVLKFDPDHWKTFLADRLTTPPGGGGALQYFGAAASHKMLADHLSAEYATRVSVGPRTFDRWDARPSRDNHLFDVLVGCCVAASVLGLAWSPAGSPVRARERPPPVKLSELYAQKHGR